MRKSLRRKVFFRRLNENVAENVIGKRKARKNICHLVFWQMKFNKRCRATAEKANIKR
jgi:hypothetical protein